MVLGKRICCLIFGSPLVSCRLSMSWYLRSEYIIVSETLIGHLLIVFFVYLVMDGNLRSILDVVSAWDSDSERKGPEDRSKTQRIIDFPPYSHLGCGSIGLSRSWNQRSDLFVPAQRIHIIRPKKRPQNAEGLASPEKGLIRPLPTVNVSQGCICQRTLPITRSQRSAHGIGPWFG